MEIFCPILAVSVREPVLFIVRMDGSILILNCSQELAEYSILLSIYLYKVWKKCNGARIAKSPRSLAEAMTELAANPLTARNN